MDRNVHSSCVNIWGDLNNNGCIFQIRLFLQHFCTRKLAETLQIIYGFKTSKTEKAVPLSGNSEKDYLGKFLKCLWKKDFCFGKLKKFFYFPYKIKLIKKNPSLGKKTNPTVNHLYTREISCYFVDISQFHEIIITGTQTAKIWYNIFFYIFIHDWILLPNTIAKFSKFDSLLFQNEMVN